MHRAAAEQFLGACRDAISSRGRFNAVLSGGTTPLGLYSLLASEPFSSRVDWSAVHLYWGDERCVPTDHSESNFGMVKKVLLDFLDIPGENVHPMKGELGPEEGARDYENLIMDFSTGEGGMLFDLVFLGLGADGHTASLFPGSRAVNEASRRVFPVSRDESGGHARITLTLPALNSASIVIFLIAGGAKAGVAARLLSGEVASILPASMIQPEDGCLEFYLDAEAARIWQAA